MNIRPIYTHFSGYQLSTGRRIFIHREIRDIASHYDIPDFVAHIESAIAFDLEVHALENAWRIGSAGPKEYPREVDAPIDRTLSSIATILQQASTLFSVDDAVPRQAQKLYQVLFPKGVKSVTNIGHVDQLLENERILAALAEPRWSELIATLGLELYRQKLEHLNRRFSMTLKEFQRLAEAPSFDTIRIQRIRGQDRLCITVAKIFAAFPGESKEEVETRARFLEPWYQQNERVSYHMRRKRPVPEVDPETGQEQSAETESDTASSFPPRDPAHNVSP